MDQQYVFEVSPQNFQSAVIDASQQQPVVILFWAQQVPPSAQMKELLERMAGQYQGKFVLGLVDVARDQTLAQHLRVQGLPSLRVVSKGQLAQQQLDGPQGEDVLRRLLDQLTMSSGDLLRAQLGELLETGHLDQALELLKHALAEEPNNPAFKVELADVLVRAGELDEARTALAAIPEGTPERERPQMRLELMEEAAGMAPLAELEKMLQGAPDDMESRYQAAVQYAAAADYEAALDQAMYILQHDRGFRDDIGRTTMLRIFSMLGKGSDLASRYRRRMFAFMH